MGRGGASPRRMACPLPSAPPQHECCGIMPRLSSWGIGTPPVLRAYEPRSGTQAQDTKCLAEGVGFAPTGGRLPEPTSELPVRRTTACALRSETPAQDTKCVAEGVGFEPTVRPKTYNGFRDRPVQPLRHPSGVQSSRGRVRSASLSRQSGSDAVAKSIKAVPSVRCSVACVIVAESSARAPASSNARAVSILATAWLMNE